MGPSPEEAPDVEEDREEVDSLTDLARYRRHSLSSIRINAVVLLVAGLAWWGLSRIIHVPRWLMIIVIGMTTFSFVGDVVNVLHVNAQIRRRWGRSGRRQKQEP